MDKGTIDNKITAPEGGDTAMPSSSPSSSSSNINNGSNNSIPIEEKTAMIDAVNGAEEISSQAAEDNEAAAVAGKAIDSSFSSKISPSGKATTTTMDTTIENITATAIPIDEKVTTIGAVAKGEDIPSPGQEEEEEATVATATSGTVINSSSTTTTPMETTAVDNATTIASSPAVKKDDDDNDIDQTCTTAMIMTEDPTTSTGDMMDAEDAAAVKADVTAERMKTEDGAVDPEQQKLQQRTKKKHNTNPFSFWLADDVADSVGAAVKEEDIV